MINGKHTYIFAFRDEQESIAFGELYKKVTGKEYDFSSFVKTRYYLEITDDFSEFKTTVLNGFIDHSYYPSNRAYKFDVLGFVDWYEHHYLVLKDYSIIKHIPHASIEFPEDYEHGILKSPSKIHYYNLKMSDIGIDLLFKWLPGKELKAKYSRLFCDVERLKDNRKEPMAKYGQGYMYTRFFDGEKLYRVVHNGRDFEPEINAYYDEWHKNLNKAVKEELDKGKKVLIVDIHSYSDELATSLGRIGPFPDICIGFNKDFEDRKLLDLIVSNITKKGYTYRFNFPYDGSIVPSDYAGNENVTSIMIEVNKRLYL